MEVKMRSFKMKYLNYILTIVTFGSCLAVSDETTYIVAFDNKADDDYIVYQRPGPILSEEGPVFVAASASWNPVLIVRAHEKGEQELLLRDPESFGLQIKLEPKNAGLPAIYLKSGIKESGDCVQPWLSGPFGVIVALTEDSLNNPFKAYRAVKRIRYCGYRITSGIVEIYSDGIKLKAAHNMKVLDKDKVDISSLKKEIKK